MDDLTVGYGLGLNGVLDEAGEAMGRVTAAKPSMADRTDHRLSPWSSVA